MEKGSKLCLPIWFSGFFGLGALMHLARLILRFPLVIGDFEVPIGLSLAIAVIFGAISIGLLWLACKPSCCASGETKK